MLTERIETLLVGNATGLVNSFREGGTAAEGLQAKSMTAGGVLERLGLQGTSTGKALDKLGISGVQSGDLLKAGLVGGAVVGGGALAKFALDGIEKFASLTSAVRGFQRVSGATAEDSSKLVFAVKEMGIEPDVAASAFGRLATRIGTGKATLLENADLIKRNSDGSLDLAGTVANLSDAYQSTDDQGKKAALANDAFGKSWQKLAPLLGKGKQDLQDLYAEAAKDHQVFSQDDLEKGRQFTLATTQLKDAWKGLQVELGSAVIPTATQSTQTLTDGLHLLDKGANLAGGSLSDTFSIVERSLNPLDNLSQGLHDAADFFGLGGDEAASFTDKQQAVQDATVKVADAISQHGKNSREARDAERELSAASKDLKGDQDAVGDSLQKVNDKLTTHTQKVYEDQQADLLAAGDKIAFGNAVAGVGTHLESLNQTLVANLVNQDGSAQATANAAQQQRDLSTAVLNVTTAAAKQAVDNLGPNASGADKMKAATDAQNGALQALYAQFPDLREQVQGYIGDLGGIPPDKHTVVSVETSGYDRLVELSALMDRLRAEPNVTVRANVLYGEALAGISDRNRKRDIEPIAAADVLEQLEQLEVTTWRYEWEAPGVHHVGPMAQDFAELFGLGTDNRVIEHVDGIGVLVAALQALAARNTALEQRVAALEAAPVA